MRLSKFPQTLIGIAIVIGTAENKYLSLDGDFFRLEIGLFRVVKVDHKILLKGANPTDGGGYCCVA